MPAISRSSLLIPPREPPRGGVISHRGARQTGTPRPETIRRRRPPAGSRGASNVVVPVPARRVLVEDYSMALCPCSAKFAYDLDQGLLRVPALAALVALNTDI